MRLDVASVLRRRSAARIDTRARVERKLERRCRADEREPRLRATATRGGVRVEELVEELERTEQHIAELEATLAARNGTQPPSLERGDLAAPVTAAVAEAATHQSEDQPDAS